MRRALVILAWLAACGSQTTPVPTPTGPAAAMQEKPAPDDVVVATVNGKSVYGSCLTAQGPRAKSKQDALEQCIAFELMAQEADARGLAADHEVAAATRTALVNELVAVDYEDKYTKPSDFGATWDQLYAKNSFRYDHEEYRASAYVRVDVPDGVVDEQARTIMTEVAAALEDERGLMPPHFKEIAERVAAGRRPITFATVPPFTRISQLNIDYAEALFAIREIGRTSPPVRTPWGWDVVLYSDVIPAERPSPEKLAEEMLPEVKRAFFATWTNQIVQRLGVKIEVVEKNLPLLENL